MVSKQTNGGHDSMKYIEIGSNYIPVHQCGVIKKKRGTSSFYYDKTKIIKGKAAFYFSVEANGSEISSFLYETVEERDNALDCFLNELKMDR